MKEIENIIIYKSIEDGIEIKKSCIIYKDGSIKEGNFEDAVVAIKEVAKERNITTKAELKEIINKEIVYTMTEEEFKNSSLLSQEKEEANTIVITKEEQEEIINDDEEVVYEENYDEENNNDNYYIDYTEEYENDSSKSDGCLKVVAGTIVVGLIIAGTAYALSRCSKLGEKLVEGTTTTTTTDNIDETTNTTGTKTTTETTKIVYNNDLYDDYTLVELLNVTTNDFQKSSMINLSSSLTGFNNIFANKYLESGHDIKAALSFDEVVALQQAYNNYSVDEVRAYFNGYEVDAIHMSNAYKSASLQLMGAYAIENKENPVDMSILIDSTEGIDFYNRYHAMFLAAKEATGEEQLKLVKEFYDSVRKDFPITEEVRTEGISHSEDHNTLKDYQLAVAPMIASAEMIFQNIDVDYTLKDGEIDFINDIGLCNHADDKFERLETIMLGAYEDNENPLFEQYRNAIIAELKKDNNYVIDDAHRELSNLRRFQEVVNHDALWKHRTTYTGHFGESYTDSYGETTITWEESSTDYTTTTTTETTTIPDEDKKKVDQATEDDNNNARKKAEEEAEAEARRQQEEENRRRKAIEDEIAEDDKNIEKDIDNINKTIDGNNKDTDSSNNKPVNENDYDNIDFDDNHSDKDGNLDDSVKNVTTDGSGANQDLPDPNVTGAKFDTKVTQTNSNIPDYAMENAESNTSYIEPVGNDAYIEYSDEYTLYDEDGNPIISKHM